ncbi:MAG: hypothetical protein EOO70_04055 [Myxococcaceae bacterium]|nr:MAG: hypothetical protein EOO70_04055 [Myxococcaceae bacterium]
MSIATPEPSTYALAPALRARIMGLSLVIIGLLLAVAALLVVTLDLSLDVLVILVAVVLVAIFGLGHLLVRRWYVVRLDEIGYRVRFVRGAGVTQARWVDVADVKAADVAGARCVVLNLRDGRSTTIPVDAIEGGAARIGEDLRRRLNKGHGIRPLN